MQLSLNHISTITLSFARSQTLNYCSPLFCVGQIGPRIYHLVLGTTFQEGECAQRVATKKNSRRHQTYLQVLNGYHAQDGQNCTELFQKEIKTLNNGFALKKIGQDIQKKSCSIVKWTALRDYKVIFQRVIEVESKQSSIWHA